MAEPTLLQIYARNLHHQAFKKGWNRQRLAEKLGVSNHVVTRILKGSGRAIDVETFERACLVFRCTPNELLVQQLDLDYDS